jgi:transposase-like protein
MTPKNQAKERKSTDKVAVEPEEIKAVLVEQRDFLQPVVQEAVQAILEMEMEECLQAGKHERTDERQGFRSGYYGRRLITRVGTMVLRVPQDRSGRFSTEVFEQYQRSEKALVAALAQMYVQGVSTRKVAAVRDVLLGGPYPGLRSQTPPRICCPEHGRSLREIWCFRRWR